MAKYQITLDEKQLRTLNMATEAFSRLCTGQIMYALEEAWRSKIWDLPRENKDMLERKCRAITLLLSNGEFDGHRGSYGVMSDKIDKHAGTAYNIHQVIRNQFWKEQPEDKLQNYSTHSSVSITNGEEAIKIEKVEDDES